MPQTQLPVEYILNNLKQQLCQCHQVILQAPPGAGKTTVVPLALLHQPWLGNQKIVMLEPRRIATRAAAQRMAEQINEQPGQTVGYRMRLESKTSRQTKIEVMTEGVLTRMIQNDPALDGVGLIIFDEFHERNLESDLALALCLQGRELFRDTLNPLKILIMSATIDIDSIAKLLEHAAIIKCEGRSYPVDIIYGRARKSEDRIVERLVATVKQALDENPDSSILAFLPGQGEIHRASEQLSSWLLEGNIPDTYMHPLYGNLSIEDQHRAIAPISASRNGSRKIVLATNIAETSLTIEGVDVIVDCGLARQPRFNPSTAMSALETVKISAASSVQRAGRAGRTGPGKCYRLWSELQQQQLAPQIMPEIINADLAPLALQLLTWGVDDPGELKWIDPPPRGAWQQAIELLNSLGAIEQKSDALVLNSHGRAMSVLGIHPRLAHLLICGAEIGFQKIACLLASLLTERDPVGSSNPDVLNRLDILTSESRCLPNQRNWLHRVHQQARQYQGQLSKIVSDRKVTVALGREQVCGYLLACAYPDRIARRRHSGAYQLANGRSVRFTDQFLLAKNQWLAVSEVSAISGGRGDIIRSAANLDKALFSTLLSKLVTTETVTEWDSKTGRFIAQQRHKIGAIILHSKRLQDLPAELKITALIQTIRSEGLQLLPWKPEHHQWLARIALIRKHENSNDWPDVSRASLLDNMDNWLEPYLSEINTLKALKKLNLGSILNSMLSWQKQQQLSQLAPLRLKVPSGASIAIDYTATPPVLAVKLQEMFGCRQNPTVVNGKVPLIVHLLSPAGRPLQITQDLAGFWQSSYHQVKKEMKGRYPKHPWPDDPLSAIATAKTKNRLNS